MTPFNISTRQQFLSKIFYDFGSRINASDQNCVYRHKIKHIIVNHSLFQSGYKIKNQSKIT
jgi:hypothetical protein